MNDELKPTDVSEKGPARRRNTQGATTVAISITVPIELNKTLEELMVTERSSKSLVAVILMEQALEARKG